jgi:hypothetical protein
MRIALTKMQKKSAFIRLKVLGFLALCVRSYVHGATFFNDALQEALMMLYTRPTGYLF